MTTRRSFHIICIEDARQKGYKGVCILSSKGRKKEFLSDYKYLTHKGFQIADESDNGIILIYLPLSASNPPQFKECARHPHINEQGFVLYYTDQCPFTDYWVPRIEQVATEYNIPLKTIHITTREQAQNLPSPVSTYALFKDGEFLTQGILHEKKFLKYAGIDM